MAPTAQATGTSLPRPAPSEYHEYYARYIARVPDGDILVTLKDQLGDTVALLSGVAPEMETFRYAEGKWSLREVIGHVIDAERMFAYRALSMARQDDVDLPGMDQDVWAARSPANGIPLAELIDEWTAVRRSTVHLFASMDPEAAGRTGRASGRSFTVRTFPWIIAGHELWHRKGIEEHYLGR